MTSSPSAQPTGSPVPVRIPVGQMPILSPPSAHWHGHPLTAHLYNPSSAPMRIHAETLLLRGGCAQYIAHDMRVTPTDFTIPPHRAVDVRITITNGAHGDFGALFVMRGTGRGVVVNRALGEQVYAGTSAHSCIPKTHRAVVPPAHHAIPWVSVVAIAVAFLAVLVTSVVILRARRNGSPPADPPSVKGDKYLW